MPGSIPGSPTIVPLGDILINAAPMLSLCDCLLSSKTIELVHAAGINVLPNLLHSGEYSSGLVGA